MYVLRTDPPIRTGIIFPLISPDQQLKACSRSRTVDTVPSTTKDSIQFCIYDVLHKHMAEQQHVNRQHSRNTNNPYKLN